MPAFEHFRDYIHRFLPLSDTAWQLMLPHLETCRLERKSLWIREGQHERWVAFVLQGSLRQYYTHQGIERTTYFYFEHHLMASYLSCLTGQPSRLSIEALTDVELIRFPYTALAALYQQSHQWERFGRLVAEYLGIGLEERMVELLMLSPEERYQALMDSGKTKILERIPQHYVANYLGITPVSLSRIRNRVLRRNS
jgi:CRP-like cAMP-binding protein